MRCLPILAGNCSVLRSFKLLHSLKFQVSRDVPKFSLMFDAYLGDLLGYLGSVSSSENHGEQCLCSLCSLTDVIVFLIYWVRGSTLHINHEVLGLCPFTGSKRAFKTNPKMCNISVPEQHSPVSSCLIGKAHMIFMKQANKQTQRVCKLPSVPSFSSSNFKLNRSCAGRWFTGFGL